MTDFWHKETTPGTTGSRCTIRDGSGLFVAECIASDAATIAAAPAMLAALQAVAAWNANEGAGPDNIDWQRFDAIMRGVGAAIAQAEGGTPTASAPIPAAQADKCAHCGEDRDEAAESTWQQWQCGACGSWNDKGSATKGI